MNVAQTVQGKLVICDRHAETRDLLRGHLTADLFNVFPAATAEDVLYLSQIQQPDLILLDLYLPDASGLDVLRTIRGSDGIHGKHDPEIPIILIGSSVGEQDRVRALNEGADDFLVRPHSYAELLARINVILRRSRRQTGGVLRIGELRIDRERREVRVGNRTVPLSRKEFLLLSTLANEPKRIFSKRELLSRVWGHESLSYTRTLDSHASRLRLKLDPDHRAYVHNEWAVGYRLLEG